jgi:hypothetical protein
VLNDGLVESCRRGKEVTRKKIERTSKAATKAMETFLLIYNRNALDNRKQCMTESKKADFT